MKNYWVNIVTPVERWKTTVTFNNIKYSKTIWKTLPVKMEEFLRANETSEEFYARCTNLSIFDCSEEEMLWCVMGPRRLPLTRIVPITAFLLLICFTGVVGNVAVCVVIVRHPAMRTDTNYYLFSLALSDLLLLLFGECFWSNDSVLVYTSASLYRVRCSNPGDIYDFSE